MASSGVTALLVAGPEAIYYLTGVNSHGYFTPAGLTLSLDEPLQLVVRANEKATVSALAPDLEMVTYTDAEDPARGFVASLQRVTGATSVIGYEASSSTMTVQVWDEVRAAFTAHPWRDMTRDLMRLRAVKSVYEIEKMRRAAELSDLAFAACASAARAGARQSELAASAYEALIRHGSEPPAFPPFIRSTSKLARAHESWDDAVLATGDGLLVEISGSVDRYHAPLTRMLFVGQVPPSVVEATEVARTALDAALEILTPGVTLGDVYQVWKRAVEADLGGDVSAPHCGYLVGTGFPPSWIGGSEILSAHAGSRLPLEQGMTLHALSWIVGDGVPAEVGISDTVLVGTGSSTRLTTVLPAPVSV